MEFDNIDMNNSLRIVHLRFLHFLYELQNIRVGLKYQLSWGSYR